jgi:hypothetical protein
MSVLNFVFDYILLGPDGALHFHLQAFYFKKKKEKRKKFSNGGMPLTILQSFRARKHLSLSKGGAPNKE